ncbi:alpha/beta hydrolase [Synoicihabitans lomoniglobus]|uniref:Alpha/beta fold hydrolase n=1 Tax=Synoicihabitans lomoniglobus TaxID=2909285 RepID=A0AAE9ZV95_9BACT|nr:alpha/beta fold hydrolase [Opitutaceae bacterium LMO-M01]WED63460.1 alpha/beta fold hydrolase [Opitutaceae bacterium LMO-M01]
MKSLPRAFVILLTVCLTAAISRADHHTSDEKLTFVLVHGATAGGYEWKETGKYLQQAGHTVYRVTLTALGERSHLSAEGVNLTTHINDVVNTILFEDLHDVILTGHSYGGMVITGVMDRIPERISHVYYFDAAVPADGQSIRDSFGNRGGDRPEPKVENGRMVMDWLPKNPTSWPHNTGHPIGTLTEPVSYKNPAALALNVTYVPFVKDAEAEKTRSESDAGWQRAKARGWTIRPYPGSHTAMLETPKGLAELILASVNDTNTPTP